MFLDTKPTASMVSEISYCAITRSDVPGHDGKPKDGDGEGKGTNDENLRHQQVLDPQRWCLLYAWSRRQYRVIRGALAH